MIHTQPVSVACHPGESHLCFAIAKHALSKANEDSPESACWQRGSVRPNSFSGLKFPCLFLRRVTFCPPSPGGPGVTRSVIRQSRIASPSRCNAPKVQQRKSSPAGVQGVGDPLRNIFSSVQLNRGVGGRAPEKKKEQSLPKNKLSRSSNSESRSCASRGVPGPGFHCRITCSDIRHTKIRIAYG